MSTIADIQATAKAKRDAKSPLDPSVIKNTASGINQ